MHEVSLVIDLIDRVREIAKREASVHIVAIDVCIGQKSGVDRGAFEFAYLAAILDTDLAKTKLRVRPTEGFEFQLESLEVQDV